MKPNNETPNTNGSNESGRRGRPGSRCPGGALACVLAVTASSLAPRPARADESTAAPLAATSTPSPTAISHGDTETGEVSTPTAPTAPTTPTAPPRRRIFGVITDVGVPDGAAIGLAVRPVEWLRVVGSITYNTSAPGARLGVTFDPLPTPVGVTLTLEGGHSFGGKLPIRGDAPDVDYTYANCHTGLEFGNRRSFRFFLHGGLSWIALDADALKSSSRSATLSNLSYGGWVAPSAKLGFSLSF